MGLLTLVRDFVKKIVKNPIKSAIVIFLIMQILKKHSGKESVLFSEDLIIQEENGKTIVNDTTAQAWFVLSGQEVLYQGTDEMQARKVFGGSKLENLYESLVLKK